MEPFVVTLLNWTPNFRWFMTRLVGKNGHEKDTTCCYEIGLCVWYMDIILDPIVDLTIILVYVIDERETKIFITLISYNLCISTLRLKLEMTISVLQNRSLDETYFQSDPTTRNICGVGLRALRKATYRSLKRHAVMIVVEGILL